ncbi:CHAT domain-containing protein [Corallococcus carmarthensis]|uniref:CHAT domain-containing protein n=1 Tax=Corallococcus carmarthensis TaxID=2316728 RepID=A0A3A8KIH4_9BACT|nr:CHAT domain-containing protein [Corallococcus carmarthensis]NOK15648.1 CHAT domain-containing protein [Corallococcus carmarthensis]RKH07933.1 CHAT domain-containing protein [Corallococcus carmarthensis]
MNLPAFVDGELPPESQDGFRAHLVSCQVCWARFHELLQVDMLGRMALAEVAEAREDPAEPGPLPPEATVTVTPPRRPPVWPRVAGLALLLALLAVWTTLSTREAPASWLTPGPTRPLEARLTYAALDGHRAYVPLRRQAPGAAPLPLRELATLADRHDWQGIATVYLLAGDPRQALAYLRSAPVSPDLDSDRAVAMALGRAGPPEQTALDEALALLDGVLLQRPDHPQALWNRALVLRDMDLPLLAADAFEAMASQGEPGWSTEARTQAHRLREETLARGRAWKQAFAATQDLVVDSGARLPLEEAARLPGIVRVAFYDAVRAAPSREATLRLLPLADALDRTYGGTVLREYVARVAARDFLRRGPLARDYALLVRDGRSSREGFLEELKRSGEDDLYVGALGHELLAGRPVDSAAFARAADGLGDPWFHLIAERERANQEVQAGEWWKAETRVLHALRTCQEQRLLYRCADLRKWLTDMYLGELHRPADASVHALRGWQLAKAQGEWGLERQFLQELAQVARLHHRLPTARAYLRESLARMPEDLLQRGYVHRNLASLAWMGFRMDEARHELEQAMESGLPLGIHGTLVLADLARFGPMLGAADAMRRALSELRRGEPRPGERALMDFIEGQFTLEHDPVAGRQLLWSAITQAEAWPDDANARRALAYAHAVLASEAGRTGAFTEVLALVGRRLQRGEVPERCVLAVTVWHERTVTVVRGPSGAVLGDFAQGRTAPLGQDASGLVPVPLVEVLRGCAQVEVLAPPPVYGLPRLLPPDLAWSYRVGRAAPPGPTAPQGTHLVVSGVDTPGALGLPWLPPMASAAGADPWRVTLEGAQATPSRVLDAMGTATEVEIHTHGEFSPEMSDASILMLAPEKDGRYVLTASQVRARRLSGAPLVFLAACSAARTAPFPIESFSLPVAFLEAGARAVLAATVDIPDSAGRFFNAVRERIRAGAPPAVALRDERRQWLESSPGDRWVRDVLLFE